MTNHARRGQLIPIFALMLVVLVGMAALGVDVGFWRYQERLMQVAADSGAVAGANELSYPASNDVVTAARDDSAANGFTNDGGVTVGVTVNNPPLSGPNAGNASAVEVIVKKKTPSYFGAAFGFTPQWISARAVATMASPNICVYALSGGTQAIQANGSPNMTATTCGFTSNGGFVVPGTTVRAAYIGYVIGPYAYNGQSYPQAQPTATTTKADPCPSIAGCAYLKAHPPSSGTCLNASPAYAQSVTIQPGRYCTILTVQGANTLTFAPGLYEFDAGMNVYGATITGTGVTFYNGPGTGTLVMQSPNISLSAPTTGNTAGVVLFRNSANTSIFDEKSAVTNFSGVMYFPTATVQNDGAANTWSFVIANVLNIFGGSLTVPTTANQYAGFTHAALSE